MALNFLRATLLTTEKFSKFRREIIFNQGFYTECNQLSVRENKDIFRLVIFQKM